ncbi:MAG: Tat pathway signal protein [Caulobacter sp. 12-67-6]|nr:MAG: Tat pathway signal protein [Caulobacter sp. 12-67-6]OYX73845.1 MAG: Tat pathway signal protein [Caulobacter sp. 32-67-35]OZA74752.1 MAG: Tat pathway signal protein [Caulobacter sp. 39-67-4]
MLLSTVAAGFAAASAPSLARAQAASEQATRMNALFDDMMVKLLRQSPEMATGLGLDKGDLAWTKGLLTDRSAEAIAAGAAQTRQQLAALRSIDRRALSGMDAVNYDTVEFVLAVQDEGNQKFTYAGGGSGAPYVLSQLTGSYQQMPDFLDTQHAIETKADADAYLQRMEGFARLMDQETLIAKRDYADGVIPPDFVIDKALIQMKSFADTPTADAPLIKSIVRRTTEKKIEGDWAGEATKVYLNSVLPALKRQIALLESVRPKATHDAGVWRLKDGADYYATSLKNYTTANLTPDEIHQLGLDMVKSIEAQADKIFKSMGMSKGTVGERMAELGKDVYDNTDAAKEQLIADLNVKAKWIEKQLPAYFGQLPKAPLEIRRVPKATEAGAPAGYYSSPSLDGKRPGIYWINLRDTKEQAKYILSTLTVHEGVPGHHLQLSLSNEAKGLPLIRKVIGFSGYTEGWALYSEELAVEMGVYKTDPRGHIGMLHDALFRAVRLVVDSGMHHKKWSREQAIKYMAETMGDEESGSITEIERYCVWPGQACSYMIGKIVWLRAREKARKALGRKFDIREFHDAGLLSGMTPLTVLETVIDNYIATRKAGK